MKPNTLQDVYERLFDRWGPQYWWPAESDLEMVLGAVLTQNTAWTNVEKAISNLRNHAVLDFKTLEKISGTQLREWIRPAGYFNQKAMRIKAIQQQIGADFDGSLSRLFELETDLLRKTLLAMKGIGPETADSILLYAARRPVFVVDAYTRRFLVRHGWIGEKESYDAVATLFCEQLPNDTQLFNEYHALIVRLGKDHCKSIPQCEGCPLSSFRPHQGAARARSEI